MPPENGHIKWALGVLASVLAGGTMASIAHQYTHGQRIAIVETTVIGLREQMRTADRKLDRLLERPERPAPAGPRSPNCKCKNCACEDCKCAP